MNEQNQPTVLLALRQPDSEQVAIYLKKQGIDVIDVNDGYHATTDETPFHALNRNIEGLAGDSHALHQVDAVVSNFAFDTLDPAYPALMVKRWRRLLPGARIFFVDDFPNLNGEVPALRARADRLITFPVGNADEEFLASRIVSEIRRLPVAEAVQTADEPVTQIPPPIQNGPSPFFTTGGQRRIPFPSNQGRSLTNMNRRPNAQPAFNIKLDHAHPHAEQLTRLFLAAGFVQAQKKRRADKNVVLVTDPFHYRNPREINTFLRNLREVNPDFALVMVSDWSASRFQEIMLSGWHPHGVLSPRDGAQMVADTSFALTRAIQPTFMSPTVRDAIAIPSLTDRFAVELRTA